MLKLKKVAITGGISCGKTEVSKFFADKGAFVVDADEIVHQLLTPEKDLGRKVIELLGTGIVANGKIDRTRVAKKVFAHPRLLRSLEQLLHPPVYEQIDALYRKVSMQKNLPLLFVAEVPLLFESGGEKYFDYTIAVVAEEEKCWDRYRKATGYEREDYSRRMARQLNPNEKAARANFVIYNNGSIEDLRTEVNSLIELICGVKVNERKDQGDTTFHG